MIFLTNRKKKNELRTYISPNCFPSDLQSFNPEQAYCLNMEGKENCQLTLSGVRGVLLVKCSPAAKLTLIRA